MDKNRLYWASRRGMLELDLVLVPFLDNVYDGLPEEDKQRFCDLMEEEDQDLFSWFMRRTDPEDSNLKIIVDIVRANTGLQPE